MAKVVQTDFVDVHIVDDDIAEAVLDESEEAERKRTLARACAAHYANFLTWQDLYVYVLEHEVKLFPVLAAIVFQDDLALAWPRLGHLHVLDAPLSLFVVVVH